ncbi:MAG: phosphate acyltransferase [Elusimicrobiota bacterium]
MWNKKIRNKAKNLNKSVIFPEGKDKRIIKAALKLKKKKIIDPTVIAEQPVKGINTIKSGGNELNLGARLVSEGKYDALVAGAINTTANVIRTGMKEIGIHPSTSTVSSFFFIQSREKNVGERGAFLFADCAVVPNPDYHQLADIAYTTAHSARAILGWEPRVAFLSFSTKGSSAHQSIEKVYKAMEELKSRKVDFDFDGELQLDTAIIPQVAEYKDPDGILKGRANILIFPELNSGNIGYKISERIGGSKAVGPILQGYKKPINDLSRGCSVEDIMDVAAFSAVMTEL